ncbi:uncharacterized protein [Littorina saxatilis]|uniref:Complex I-B17 n=1 Tax=Littorina saxatilis TaxID=31220 RepID=A0AAN9B980_9CAEN
MADEKPCPDAFVPEKKWQIEQRWVKQDYYRGSQYPPFSVEPVPYERQRLAGAGMSAEDRALRRQWIKDQQLSPNEPRYVKELTPRNAFRRVYMGLADSIFSKLIPLFGRSPASMMRVVVPRLGLILLVGYWSYYQLKYNPKDWTRSGGFHVFRNKPMILSADKVVPEKKHDDFHDQGFKARAALRDGKTSGQV